MTRDKRKVLFVANDHPALHRGGVETYVRELYNAVRDSGDYEPLLIARIGSEDGVRRSHRPGAPIASFDEDPHEYVIAMDHGGFDFLHMTFRDTSLYTRYFADFIDAQRPDVVHFQDSLYVGCEAISVVRQRLPSAAIVCTLHDYRPICHRDGVLVRTSSPATSETEEQLCLKASPRRCHECFPQIGEQEFFYRRRFIEAHLRHVDLFLAPSRFLRERYVDWGIAPERIRLEDYGRPPARRVPERREGEPRTRLGFFGQLGPYKGIDVLLRAMRMLRADTPAVQLRVHGSNAWKYSTDHQERLWSALREAERNVSFAGGYDRKELPELMAEIDWVVVPSRWWENSPLVVQEAFKHGRPVICSGIGGLAEKVADGVNGLHFAVGDPASLADAIRKAARTPGLWEQLRDGIPPVHTMDEHVATLTGVYGELLERAHPVEEPALG
jgi:glycosyltransferase involved in cell wall biosynthesis